MTQSNRDIPMAPRQRPMPHEGPPTTRDLKSLTIYVAIGLIAVAAMVIGALLFL
jgi:hypothetical protein